MYSFLFWLYMAEIGIRIIFVTFFNFLLLAVEKKLIWNVFLHLLKLLLTLLSINLF